MLLKTITLAGFKSFRKRIELPLSDRTTVLIGPNDHGKTNALSAIERLNPESKFEPSEVNDRFGDKDEAYLSYTLSLSHPEVKLLTEQVVNSESYQKANQGEVSDPSAVAVADTATQFASVTKVHEWLTQLITTRKIDVIRYCEKPLQVKLDELPEVWRPSLSALILDSLPKVILFKADALRQLPDTVDASGLQSNEVMQGVFRLAEIWDDRENLLAGNTRRNHDALRDASETLTS
jgi:AAA ATPase domain